MGLFAGIGLAWIRTMRKQSIAVSISLHSLAVIAGFWLGTRVPTHSFRPENTRNAIPLHTPRDLLRARKAPAEGGGGQRMPLPASRGMAPPVAHRVFVPPMIPQNEDPKLVMQPALLDAPAMNIQASQYGDPLGKFGIPSGGPGGPGGIGSGGCCGIGPGDGSRLGWKESTAPPRRYSRHPEVISKTEPEFTEEARKARHQGSVLLAAEVGVDGKAHNIRVVRSLGLGLDERAIAALAEWKFRPAIADGKPATAPATIEVFFRLL